MSKDKAPVKITIIHEAHEDQPYAASIDKPGPKKADKVPGRFTERSNARRAARAKLAESGAVYQREKQWYFKDADGERRIEFIFKSNRK